jgi:hypothetical protein
MELDILPFRNCILWRHDVFNGHTNESGYFFPQSGKRLLPENLILLRCRAYNVTDHVVFQINQDHYSFKMLFYLIEVANLARKGIS